MKSLLLFSILGISLTTTVSFALILKSFSLVEGTVVKLDKDFVELDLGDKTVKVLRSSFPKTSELKLGCTALANLPDESPVLPSKKSPVEAPNFKRKKNSSGSLLRPDESSTEASAQFFESMPK